MLQLAGNEPDTLRQRSLAANSASTASTQRGIRATGHAILLRRVSARSREVAAPRRCVAAMPARPTPGLVCSCRSGCWRRRRRRELARRLEAAGAGASRFTADRGPAEGTAPIAKEAADLDAIGVVAAAVSNGNTSISDVAANMATTGCAGVMAGRRLLRDPLSSLRARERADGPSAARCSPRRSSTISPSATRPRAPSSAATCCGGSAGAARPAARRLRTAGRTHRRSWAWRPGRGGAQEFRAILRRA